MLLAALFALQPARGAEPLDLRQARATTTVHGVTRTEAVTLPYNWDRQQGGQPGVGTFDLPFALAAVPTEPQEIFFARLGNAYEVRLNGVLLERRGELAQFNTTDHSQVPRRIALPSGLLREANLLQVRIRADGGRRAGVPVPLVGPAAQVRELYRVAYAWRFTGSLVVVILSLVVGTVALVLWLTQTDPARPHARRDSLYLYAAAAEFSWALRVASVLIEEPPLAWPLWGTLVALALGAWVCCMLAFSCIGAGWREKPAAVWMMRALWGVLAAGVPMVFVSLNWHLPWLLTLWYAAVGLIGASFCLFYLGAAIRRPRGVMLVLALALALNAAVAVRDWVVFRFGGGVGYDAYARYSSVLFGLVLCGIVVARFRAASLQARDLMATLAARVAQREAELESSFRKLEQLAREQERVAERTRILRDMHDGVGSHITAAMRQLQSGRASSEQVLQTLGDSLDQLKLSIDAMHLPPGDITALLANLRYRLEPRFAASDIELQWNVDLLPPVERLDAGAMRQLQFMVFEAMSNVLQHAQAGRLRIEACAWGAGARLRIVDDGRGFDVAAPARKGLAAMRERAAAIGAELRLESEPGRTVVEFVLA